MNCSIVNAYPQNVSIDAATMSNRARNAFKFTFYGDRTIGADFFVYNMDTNELWNKKIFSDYAAGANKLYYYNGEEIDTLLSNVNSNNDKQFVWKVRVYDDVNIQQHKYPTIKISSGTTKESPFITGQTLAPVMKKDGKEYIVNTLILNIDTTKTITIPSWIIINNQRRVILEAKVSTKYDPDTKKEIPVSTRIKLKNEFEIDTGDGSGSTTGIIPEGTNYKISPYKNTSLSDDVSNLYIAPGIAIDGSETTDHREGHLGSSTNLPYPKTNMPCYYLEFQGLYYAIKTYDKSTGHVTFVGSYPTNIDVGTPYNLFCSYIESPFFYFTTQSTPVINQITSIVDAEVIKFTARLDSVSRTKYQLWEIYDVTNTGGDITNNSLLVDTSEKIYMDSLEYVFRGYISGRSYKARLYVMTQVNWEVSADSTAIVTSAASTNIDSNSITMSYSKDKNAIELSYKHINALSGGAKGSCGTKILRQEYGSDDIVYVATVNKTNIAAGSVSKFIDYDAVSRKKYRYYLCDFVSTADGTTRLMYLPTITPYYQTDFYTYSIYFLQEEAYTRFDVQTDKRIDYDYMYAERNYKIIDIVRPEINVIDKHSISHNLGRNTYTGYAEKSAVAAWDTTYDTFSLTFQLGNTEVKYPDGTVFDSDFTQEFANSINYGWTEIVNNDEIYYKKLKNLIASGAPVMIKDYKGNKWFGSIVSHNSEIDNTQPVERSITEKIDFTETYPVSKVRILSN